MTQLASPSPRRAHREAPAPVSLARAHRGRHPPVRGRHATASGQGFGYLVTWSVLGTALPGSGLLAAGRRAAGWFFLLLSLMVLGALGAFVVTSDDPLDAGLRLAGIALDPQLLLYAAIAIAVVALAWVGVIIATHVSLRRDAALTRGQKVLSAALVLGLVGGVLAPAAYAADMALVQRALISTVFQDAESEPAVAGERPQVEQADPWANFPRVNVLLIGSDAGSDREGLRPDTLILASIDTTTGDTVLFSLPRNLERVPFPLGTPGNEAWPGGYWCESNGCMINSIWSWAEANADQYYPDDPNPGLTATQDAVEGVLGLKVDTYAMLNLRGFQQFVDAIGGIRIDVPRDIPIGGGTSLAGNKNPITGYIDKGDNQLLDGYQALWFARSRDGSTDYDRMRRQRCVIGAIIQQSDPVTLMRAYPELARTAQDNISTDIPQQDLQAWVELSLRVKDGSVRSLPFTDEVIANRANPDFDRIQELVQEALTTPAPTLTPSATPSASSSPGGVASTPSPAPVDEEVAQDVTAVC